MGDHFLSEDAHLIQKLGGYGNCAYIYLGVVLRSIPQSVSLAS